MLGLVRAVAALTEASLQRYAVVGGVAVAARLGQAHRATADVDAVVDETVRPPTAVEALLELPETEPDPEVDHRVYVEGTKIEILPVGPVGPRELEGVPEQDALFAASHSWALATATPLTIVALVNPSVRTTALFATPAALLAMKLHAIQTRRSGGAHKRAGDAWDIYRILVDLDAEGKVRRALIDGPPELRRLVCDAAERILVTEPNRTRSWLVQGDESMASVRVEELRYVGTPLVAALR
jgi:hypothetical protein